MMTNGVIVLKFTDGILNQEKYMLLKKLAAACSSETHFLILPVSPDDVDALNEMVTTAAFFIDEKSFASVIEDNSAVLMLKKLGIASRYIVAEYKTVVDYGNGREERDCTLSIVTPAAHIHIPADCSDKATERFIAVSLGEAKKLFDEGKSGYLIYYDSAAGKAVVETKDEYVQRKYFDSGIVKNDAAIQ